MSISLTRRLCSLGFSLLLLASFCFSQKDKAQISLYGGFNHYMTYGSVDDYIQGINDFPVKPSHSTFGFGGAIKVFINSRIALEMEGRLASSTKVKLEDPSDQDTLEMNTSRHFSVAANFIYQIPFQRIRPYFLFGIGLDKMMAKEATILSEYGYEVISEVPLEEDLLDPLVQAGAGILYVISKDIGLRVGVRYTRFFQNEYDIDSVTVIFGIVFDL